MSLGEWYIAAIVALIIGAAIYDELHYRESGRKK